MSGHEDRAREDRAREYREKAEELRAMLEDIEDDFARGTLERVAAGYDELAQIQEKLAEADKLVRRS